MRQIIAIGGGGFGREIKDLKIEKYIVEQCRSENPNICFIPTATGDDQGYIDNFYKAFDSLGCKTSHINFFKRTINLEDHIKDQDIFFIGGGNTKSMLAVWRDWGLDKLLYNAYKKGAILSGVSAGAICWFEQAISDSLWPLIRIDGLGWVKGSVCGHYDSEPERRPTTQAAKRSGQLIDGYAMDDFTAIHFINEAPHRFISSKAGQKIYRVDDTGEHPLPVDVI